MQEVFKVVGKDRYGANATAFQLEYSKKEFNTILKTYPILQPFFPVYIRNSLVKAVPKSLRIMCFKDKYYAEAFISKHNRELRGSIIIEVLGPGKPLRPRRTIPGCFDIRDLYCSNPLNRPVAKTHRYPGTITFRAIRVLT